MTKSASLAWCIAAYGVAALVAAAVGRHMSGSSAVGAAAAADIAATLVVFAFSVGLNNSSVYDPYWSVAPLPIALYWSARAGTMPAPRTVMLVALLAAWGVRLTYNWVRRWAGISHEDWRYHDFRGTAGRAYWLVSFAGFHLFPTVLVFLGCLALVPSLARSARPLGRLDLAAMLVVVGAIALEAAADRQLCRFRQSSRTARQVLESGLWALCRHPNYLGEVLFWWGVYLFGVAANPSAWWTVAGPLAMTALFAGVSVPMMDRHMLQRYPNYAAVMRRRAGLLPWRPPRSTRDPGLG